MRKVELNSHILAVFLILSLSGTLSAQDKTMYFLGVEPQSNLFNPAFQNDSVFLVFSLSGSSFINNPTLTYNDLFTTKTINGAEDMYWDFENIDRKLKDKNFIIAGIYSTPFFLGIKLKNQWFLNFSASVKGNSYFKYPGTISSIRFGNADLENNKPRIIDLNNYSINELTYAEYSFGVAKELSPALKVGVHAKALMGISAIKTNHFYASVNTKDDFSESLLETDILMHVSGTLFNTDKVEREFETTKPFKEFLTGKESISLRNFGAAMDLGFSYKINQSFTLYGSITDLGFIKWGLEPQQLVSKDQYLFTGFYFSPYTLKNDFSFNKYLKQLADTVISTIIPETKNEKFITGLYPKTFLGLTYQYSPKISFNGLISSTIYNDVYILNGTIGTTWVPYKKLALTSTFSYSNFSLCNFGLGVLLKFKRFQYYCVTDNIAGIDLANSRNSNFSMGVNWKIIQRN